MRKEKNKTNGNRRVLYSCIILFAIVMINSFYPLRILALDDWWLNTLVYGAITGLFLLAAVRAMRRYAKEITMLLFICTLLTGWQAFISARETGTCAIEDLRHGYYIICWNRLDDTYFGYQQIIPSPIGMHGYHWWYY